MYIIFSVESFEKVVKIYDEFSNINKKWLVPILQVIFYFYDEAFQINLSL